MWTDVQMAEESDEVRAVVWELAKGDRMVDKKDDVRGEVRGEELARERDAEWVLGMGKKKVVVRVEG